MADKKDEGTPTPDTNTEPSDEEKAYWEKFSGVLDSWWDNKIKTYREERPTGTSRTGNKRVTLPGLIADIVFGPEKD